MKILLLNAALILCSIMVSAQSVGINTTGAAPQSSAMLHVDGGSNPDKGFLVTGSIQLGSVPNLGTGNRMMYYPGKGVFRAGFVVQNGWDDAFAGVNSTAIGYNPVAIGYAATALGHTTTAVGDYSVALGGPNNDATGISSTAMGNSTSAVGLYSTALGSETLASGIGSTAIGENTRATGIYSTAMGTSTIASGNNSTATGAFTTASGHYSTAMGFNVSTNNQEGAFVIGDSDPNNQGVAMPGISDLFVARFNNGYYLYTSGVASNFGVALNHNGNAWLSVCDKNRKENFEQLNGEDILQKLSKMNFTSWNYKQQDPKVYRHYGIMAQDFYKAFGHDKYGTIGNDTTVNPIDMIGIDMAAIQALEIRTTALKAENAQLKSENNKLEARLQKLEDLLLKK